MLSSFAAAVLLLMLGQAPSEEGPRLNVVSPVATDVAASASQAQGVDVKRLDAIEQLVRGHLGCLAALSERLVDGHVRLF